MPPQEVGKEHGRDRDKRGDKFLTAFIGRVTGLHGRYSVGMFRYSKIQLYPGPVWIQSGYSLDTGGEGGGV